MRENFTNEEWLTLLQAPQQAIMGVCLLNPKVWPLSVAVKVSETQREGRILGISSSSKMAEALAIEYSPCLSPAVEV